MNKAHTGRYVKVNSSGKVELRLTSGGVLSIFAFDAVFAILTGDIIQANLKNGSTVFYKLSESGNTVSGPYMSI
jgi:hypothetical protein